MNRPHHRIETVANLLKKELHCLWRDKILMVLILWAFSGAIYTAATATSVELHNAPIAIVDEDHSQLSKKLQQAFYAPHFTRPTYISFQHVDASMDSGRFTFVLVIPQNFEQDVTAGKQPTIQLNIDATRMSQSFIGSTYIQNIISGELKDFIGGQSSGSSLPLELITRYKYNPNLTSSWFGAIMEIISNVTILSIILCGAAVIREREHGTLEHLLVMPVRPVEIVASKIIANGIVVLIAVTLSMLLVVQRALGIPLQGSLLLFILGAALHLFATTSMGIYLGTVARTMPQLGLLLILIILPLQLLSGAITPRESMPDMVQWIMLATPNTHFVSLAQAILYRGAGVETVWVYFIMLIAIGSIFFSAAVAKFRQSVARM